jgi:hypothetical protein
MATIDPRIGGIPTQHIHKVFASNATDVILVSNFGTGISIVPIHFRWAASGQGSIFLTYGTAGAASIFRTQTLAAFQNQDDAWWDPNPSSVNTEIRIQVPSTLGTGEFDIWFVVVRGGAGAGALTQ